MMLTSLILVLAALLTAPAHQPADTDWPERVVPTGGFARGVVVPLAGAPDGWRGVRVGLASPGALQAGRHLGLEGVNLVSERAGSYIFLRNDDGPESSDKAGSTLLFVSGRSREGEVHVERTWFGVYPALTAETRGTAVVLPGMFGTPVQGVDLLVASLRRRGWAVVRMLSHPSRFTEYATVTLDVRESADVGAELATLLTERAAECAYATRAVMEHLEQTRPDLPQKTCVIVSLSGGAMVTPTVVAHDPVRYDGAILIGGGVNLFRITLESNYASWIDAVRMPWAEGQGSAEDLERINNAYLEAAALDSYHTASTMHDMPVLLVQGARDKAVPSEYGDLLWEQLGRPERKKWRVGHELLFAMASARMGSLLAWFDEALE